MSVEIVRSADHQYRVDGELMPGVTSILRETKLSADWSRVPPDALDRARDRGRRVHAECWQFAAGPGSWGQVPDDVFGYVEAFERYCMERQIAILTNERLVYHPTLKYAGTLDAIGGLPDGMRVLIDLKTGDPDDAGGGFQTAAYLAAYTACYPEEAKLINARECVQLHDDGHYTLHPYRSSPGDFRAFCAALATLRLRHPSWKGSPNV